MKKMMFIAAAPMSLQPDRATILSGHLETSMDFGKLAAHATAALLCLQVITQ